MARVNYQREKRLKDLDRQRKQEEKRRRKLERSQGGPPPTDGPEEGDEASEAPAAPEPA